jgi:hypothetical protein
VSRSAMFDRNEPNAPSREPHKASLSVSRSHHHLIDLDSIASHLIIVSLETFLLDVVVVVMTALIVHPGSPNRSGSAFACLPLLASIIAGTYALGSIAHQ